ncbi:MAG: hypothetical protein LBD41_07775 [Clostridiales Family XIII bacterium]|nr:hypothetical protein [Clostridiales Family XIII bacterium]
MDKSGCVSFKGQKYTGKGLINFIAHKVDILSDPSNDKMIWAELEGLPKIELKKLVIKEFVPKTAKSAKNNKKTKSKGSRLINAANMNAEKLYRNRMESLYGPDWENSDAFNNGEDSSAAKELSNDHESEILDSDNLVSLPISDVKPNGKVEKNKSAISFRKMNRSDTIINKSSDVKPKGISFIQRKHNEDNSDDKGSK